MIVSNVVLNVVLGVGEYSTVWSAVVWLSFFHKYEVLTAIAFLILQPILDCNV